MNTSPFPATINMKRLRDDSRLLSKNRKLQADRSREKTHSKFCYLYNLLPHEGSYVLVERIFFVEVTCW